ncbi:MAG: ATP-binding cassette domain-containing protein [Lentisphaerae bacterium]|nr:ATP-binding cassette domain-containing protein [Lentisphaerota bacterium]
MIILDHISIAQGNFRMRNICMEVPRGAYAVLIGSTGSGKTTLLEVICGLRRPDGGRLILNGSDVTNATPASRDVGYVPQEGALFKTMTVFEQLAFALVVRREKSAAIEARVMELAQLLGVEHLLDRFPAGLSGGECQRVALGRALSFRPGILLLDEPLCSLDDDTRTQIVALLKRVQEHTGVTALHVTHNKAEAEQLGTMGLRIEKGSVLPMTT